MVPLNILTFIAIAVATYRAHKRKSATKNLWYAALAVIFLCSITYPLIFDGANRVMTSPGADAQAVAESFDRWSGWHWVRTLLSFASLGLVTVIISQSTSTDDQLK